MAKENNNNFKAYDTIKASELCFRAIFGDDYGKNKNWIFKKYEPFKNYLESAFQAAKQKKSNGAKFTIVNSSKNYNLSRCLIINLESKIVNGKIINDPTKIEAAKEFGLQVVDIKIEKVTVNNINTKFTLLENGSAVIESNGNIVVNDNPNLQVTFDSYIPNSVIYNKKQYSVRGNTVTIDNFIENYCYDTKYNIKFNLYKESESSNKNELILQLEDSQANEISVFDIFFNESAVEVFFDDNEREKFTIKKKNKEAGRITIKVDDKNRNYISNYKKVYLATNTNQLSKQSDALMAVMKRPSLSQKTLINICKSAKERNRLEEFNFQPNNSIRYKILTDANRDGTSTQRDFVQKALQTPDFMILQGPPGSGKTTAILELVYQLIKQGKKVLLCASTHVAIDNVLEKIITNKDHDELLSIINPVRVGDEYNVYSECVKPYIYDNIMSGVSDNYKEIVCNSFNLVCGTTIGVLRFPLIDKAVKNSRSNSIEPIFDYMILDEASKTTFSEFLVPGILSKRWIIVGDVKQLAPYVEKNDLVPTLLTCPALEKQGQREGLTFLNYIKNNRFKPKNGVYILSPSAIEYIDKHVTFDTSIIAVTNSKLDNVFTINKIDLEKKNYKVVGLSSNATILIEEGFEAKVLPYLNKDITLLDLNHDLKDETHFNKYAILHHRKSFPPDYSDRVSDYSRKIEDEILWRLIRLYELNKNQGAAKNYQKYFNDLKQILNDEEKKQFEQTIKTLKDIAIPSIIMMLQIGIDHTGEYTSIIEAGFTEAEKQNRFVMLEYQHRMHSDISKKSRIFVYEDKALKDSKAWASKMVYPGNEKSRFEIKNVNGITNLNNSNIQEVDAIINELQKFMCYAKDHRKMNGEKYSIAILSFYNGQVFAIRKKLQSIFNCMNIYNFHNEYLDISLNSVDKFQGQEADIVYLSMVQTKKDGFLDSVNRVNVALTRAKEKIIIFGNVNYFKTKSKSDFLKFIFKED